MSTRLDPLAWSDWVPLAEAGRDRRVPPRAGLYRIRRVGSEGLDYIGQTGNSLRGRLGMLAGVFRDEMPYRDPHTAGPALWAMRQAWACQFEASITSFDGPGTERKGLEALAISLYRLEHGGSPTVNFGRVPAGYRSSSGNNARLVASGKRFRGGPDPEARPAPETIPVHGDLEGDVIAESWMGWSWSPWRAIPEAATPRGTGLYRIRSHGASTLLYVGQGQIADRLTAHLAKASKTGHRQAAFFATPLEASWIAIQAPVVHLLEHENDLIASHVYTTGRPPAAQFLG